jgi:hypothetical protein
MIKGVKVRDYTMGFWIANDGSSSYIWRAYNTFTNEMFNSRLTISSFVFAMTIQYSSLHPSFRRNSIKLRNEITDAILKQKDKSK